jgi:hypothetical protein
VKWLLFALLKRIVQRHDVLCEVVRERCSLLKGM